MIQQKLTLKDHFLEYRLFTNRVIVLLVFCAMMLLALFARLFYLQVVSHEHFTTLSEDNRVKLQAIAPNRGLIYMNAVTDQSGAQRTTIERGADKTGFAMSERTHRVEQVRDHARARAGIGCRRRVAAVAVAEADADTGGRSF